MPPPREPRRDQFDLFPAPRRGVRRSDAVLAKKAGMEASERGANPAWVASMMECIHKVCRCCRVFNSDYVMKFYTGKEKTHDLRALGPLMRRAAKLGWCELADLPPRNSTRRTLHASPREMWRSRIYEGPR